MTTRGFGMTTGVFRMTTRGFRMAGGGQDDRGCSEGRGDFLCICLFVCGTVESES